jgi:class 3 adenylate cyclase
MAEAARGSIATILFTDVLDSSAFLQRLGDERALALLDRARRQFEDLGMTGWLRRAAQAAHALAA